MTQKKVQESDVKNFSNEKQTAVDDTQKITVQQVESRWRSMFSDNGNLIPSIGAGQIFPSQFVNGIGSMFINDPYMMNQRVKQLKTTGRFLERSEIENALTSPDQNELTIRQATKGIIGLTYPLYRLQMLYEGILTYRYYIEPRYVSKKDMKSPRFKSDWKLVDMWGKKLNPARQFRRIVSEVILEGKRAYYIRQSYNSTTEKENVDYVYFQELPSDWYKIIKHSTDSYEVVAFNFSYFWQAGTDLGQFPPVFAQYYKELMSITSIGKNGKKYIDKKLAPKDVVIEYNSETMEWFYWKELPANECFTFCFTESDDLQISPFASLLLQAQDLGSYSLLQQQLLTVPLYSMILGELPINDNNKSGNFLDDFTLSPEAVKMFEAKVNSTLPPGTTYNMVPSVENELYHFQEIPNANKIYNSGLQQLINTSGASTLMTTTEKPSVAQVSAGKIIETRFIDRMYAQFENACNILLADMKIKGDLKFDWQFFLHGDSFSEKDKLEATEKSLSLGQLELFPEYLSYHSKTLLDAVSNADWVESSGLYDSFKPLINTFGSSNQTSSKSSGRKKIDENKIENDNTAKSIDSGTNVAENRFSISKCIVCGKELDNNSVGPFCSDDCKETYILENYDEYGERNE